MHNNYLQRFLKSLKNYNDAFKFQYGDAAHTEAYNALYSISLEIIEVGRLGNSAEIFHYLENEGDEWIIRCAVLLDLNEDNSENVEPFLFNLRNEVAQQIQKFKKIP